METVRIRDPGWKKVGSGIRDKHPGSSTLLFMLKFLKSYWYRYLLSVKHTNVGTRKGQGSESLYKSFVGDPLHFGVDPDPRIRMSD
jgi:hypothetical protein